MGELPVAVVTLIIKQKGYETIVLLFANYAVLHNRECVNENWGLWFW